MREFTFLAIILGIIISIVFGAANAFIGLKVGMTVSASIPAAVISMAILRGILRRGTVLENNMVQTIGSVGESLAAGMIFTIPALFIFAYVDENDTLRPSLVEMTIWGALGGILGVLFMIPLRRMLIVREHHNLPYPEGTACAEVLESGQRGGAGARTVFGGLGIAAFYEFVRGLGFWKDTATQRLPLIKSEFQLATEPALLGVGYILGVRIAAYMLSGAVLGWFVIIPAISFFGADVDHPVSPEPDMLIPSMTPDDMWNRYLRYIGAGAVVLGGLVSLFKSLGTIGGSLFHMFGGGGTGERTDRDIPTFLLLLLLVGVGAAMYYLPTTTIDWSWLPAWMGEQTGESEPPLHAFFQSIPVIACVIGFGFFFVTVSSRLVGIVGSSSNPASGMTIATLLGTTLILVYAAGLEGVTAKVAAISVGAIVCIAICISGDCSQDLKTGFLVRATPWKQQIGELLSVLISAGAIAIVISLVADRYGFFQDADHPNAVLAPQANLMKLLVEGVVDRSLPWELIFTGMACALIVEMLGVPSLPFAVGLYLPLSLSTPIMVGGVLRWFIDRRRRARPVSEAEDPGVLAASGLVAGQGLVGVFFVGVAAFIGWYWNDPRFVVPEIPEWRGAAVVEAAPAPDMAGSGMETTPFLLTAVAAQDGDGADVAESPPNLLELVDAIRDQVDRPEGELVVPKHFYPWLTTQVSGLERDYGLVEYTYEGGAFRDEYAVNLYKLLPLGPFLLLTLWLAWVASKRLPPPTPEPVHATGAPGADPLSPISPAPTPSDADEARLRETFASTEAPPPAPPPGDKPGPGGLFTKSDPRG